MHYSRLDPDRHRGGVESFAHNLRLVFEQVEFMTPATFDVARVRRDRLPVICDNQLVLDWPNVVPVIGFRHGAAWKKAWVTRSLHDVGLAARQARAARRDKVTWVSCARWIERAFSPISRVAPAGTIYHPVDLRRFDGKLHNSSSRLILHDARSEHKGKRLVERLARDLSDYRFEPLACPGEQVPDRMRGALAFMHLSRYEGNSIVCNEAMAMDLPCLFTRVGLMLDGDSIDVETIEPALAFENYAALLARVRTFLASLSTRRYRPRAWVVDHASIEVTRRAWADCLEHFRRWEWPSP